VSGGSLPLQDSHSGDGFRYALRRSARARNIRITVGEDGVTLTLPDRVAERHGHEFVAQRTAWIQRTLARIETADEIVASRPLADGTAVPLLDEELTLRISSGPSGRARRVGDELRVRVPDDSRATVALALERWYRREARALFADRLDRVVARNGTAYTRVAVRDQKTRWGSCSTSGTVSFNWRLLLAPSAVVDYVVEHEAAHLEVRDHSPRFWALIDARVEHWRDSRLWLRRHGATLRLI
jgi:predicted metal-dependent hydrolase